MAVERPLSQLNTDPLSPLRSSQSRLNGASIVLHESLVAPEKKKTVPNHLLDTSKKEKQKYNLHYMNNYPTCSLYQISCFSPTLKFILSLICVANLF